MFPSKVIRRGLQTGYFFADFNESRPKTTRGLRGALLLNRRVLNYGSPGQ